MQNSCVPSLLDDAMDVDQNEPPNNANRFDPSHNGGRKRHAEGDTESSMNEDDDFEAKPSSDYIRELLTRLFPSDRDAVDENMDVETEPPRACSSDMWRICRSVEVEYSGNPAPGWFSGDNPDEWNEKQIQLFLEIFANYEDILKYREDSEYSTKVLCWLSAKILSITIHPILQSMVSMVANRVLDIISWVPEEKNIREAVYDALMDNIAELIKERERMAADCNRVGKISLFKKILQGSELVLPSPINEDQSVDVGEVVVELKKKQHAERLQSALCSLLSCRDEKLLLAIPEPIFAPRFPHFLKQIEIGGFELKAATLWLMQKIVKEGLCPSLFFQFLVDHLLTLSLFLEKNPKNPSNSRCSKSDAVETALSACLSELGRQLSVNTAQKSFSEISETLLGRWLTRLMTAVKESQGVSSALRSGLYALMSGFTSVGHVFLADTRVIPDAAMCLKLEECVVLWIGMPATLHLDIQNLIEPLSGLLRCYLRLERPVDVPDRILEILKNGVASLKDKEKIIDVLRTTELILASLAQLYRSLGDPNSAKIRSRLISLVGSAISMLADRDTLVLMLKNVRLWEKTVGIRMVMCLAQKIAFFLGVIPDLTVDFGLMKNIFCIIGYPWFSEEVKHKDRVLLNKELSECWKFVSKAQTHDLKIMLVPAVAIFPKISPSQGNVEKSDGTSSTEKGKKILELSLANSEDGLKEAALGAFPLFGLGLQRNGSYLAIIEVLDKYIGPFMTATVEGKDLVYSAIAGILCTASGNCEAFFDNAGKPCFKCVACSGESECEPKKSGLQFEPKAFNVAVGRALNGLQHAKNLLPEKLAVCDLLLAILKHVDDNGKHGGVNFEDLMSKSLWILNDPSPDLREKYCGCLKSVVRVGVSDDLSGQIQVAITGLNPENIPDNMEWVIKYLGIIATNCKEKKLRTSCMIKMVLLQMFHGADAKTTKDWLRNLAKYDDVEGSLHSLYKRNADQIWKFLVREFSDLIPALRPFVEMPAEEEPSMSEDEFGRIMDFVKERCERGAWLFSYEIKEWLRLGLRYSIAWILLEGSGAASLLHASLSRILNKSRNIFIQEQFPYIVLKMALELRGEAERKIMIGFLEEEGKARNGNKWEFGQYMTNKYQKCIFVLLVFLSLNEDKLIEMMCALSSILEIEDEFSIHAFLRTRFMGAMIQFRLCFDDDVDIETKKMALNSLQLIIKETKGPLLDEHTGKLATVLRSATQQQLLSEEVAEVWLALTTNLTPAVLVEYLPTILVSIEPVLEEHAITALCRYVFMDKSEKIWDTTQYKDMCAALTDLPGWDRVHHYVRTAHPDSSIHQLSLEDTVNSCLRLLRYEFSDIKLLALKKLEYVLSLKMLDIDSEDINGAVSNLVRSLIETLQTCDDTAVRQMIAKCFGELGAIDPGRLGMDLAAPIGLGYIPDRRPGVDHFAGFGNNTRASGSIGADIDFAKETLVRMAKTLNAASDPNQHDNCGLSVQEVLKCFGCHKDGYETPNTEPYHLWKSLPLEVQRALKPFTRSSYSGKRPSREPNWPVYGQRGYDYGYWLATWISQTIGKENKCPEAETFFVAVMYMVDQDAGFAKFILPHAVLQGIIDGDASFTNNLRTEVLAVLRSCDEEQTNRGAADYRHLAAQTVFGLLDILKRWCKLRNNAEFKEKVVRVKSFLKEIPADSVFKAAVSCQSYARALINLEDMKKNRREEHQLDFFQLQKLYSQLMEPDGVEGALAQIRSRREPTRKESILAYETFGDYHKALPYHESAAQLEPKNPEIQIGLMKCLLGLKEPKIVNHCMESFLGRKSELEIFSEKDLVELNSTRVEAAWKLQEWNEVEQITNDKDLKEQTWELTIGELLLSLKQEKYSDLNKQLKRARSNLIGPLVASTMETGAYERAYPYICKLHIFAEIDHAAQSLQTQHYDHLIQDWDSRLKLMQGTSRTVEPLLEIRRQLIRFFPASERMNQFKQMCWVQSARFSRVAGHLQVAWSSLVKAKEGEETKILMETFMEQAKYHWANNEKNEAIASIQKGLKLHFPDLMVTNSTSQVKPIIRKTADKAPFVKAQTLLTQYASEASAFDGRTIRAFFERLKDQTKGLKAEAEQAWYRYALFCDSEQPSLDMSLRIIQVYARVLSEGSHYLFHCLPRILTTWLDQTQKFEDDYKAIIEKEKKERSLNPDKKETREERAERERREATAKVKRDNLLQQFNELVRKEVLDTLPVQQLYSGFSQMISRITHPSESVFEMLKEIMLVLFKAYPAQCMWLSVGVYLSDKKTQKYQRCAKLYGTVKRDKEQGQLLEDIVQLAILFMQLAKSNLDKKGEFSLKTVSPKLAGFVEKKGRSQILIPLHSLMELCFVRSASSGSHSAGHSQDSSSPTMSTGGVYIEKLEDRVQTMTSLQVPKKIGLRGTDGKLYHMMCKSKDDLHKDKRLMEFNQVVNHCLRQVLEARRRHLHVRTYSVIPLGSDGGLVEWVENMIPMRTALVALMDNPMSQREWSVHSAKPDCSVNEKLKIFRERFLPRHPDVMSGWLLEKFPEPSGWYAARLGYTRTTSVMSMVGFILGLGDRHLENILLDYTCGHVFHVDFNLLFNSAEDLGVPERVPFRLTHNMVDGFGVLGVEGPFRKASEITMQVLRDNKGMLLTVLHSYLYDPLVEWTRPLRAQQIDPNAKKGAPALSLMPKTEKKKAEHVYKYIEDRLSGHIVTPKLYRKPYNKALALPLSVESQVEQLIQLATDEENLCQMFVGWCPFF